MTTALSEIRDAWEQRRDASDWDPTQMEFVKTILRELAKGTPVSPARAAEILPGVDEDSMADAFARASEMGAEVDGDGALVGNALTLNPTSHRFRVNGNDLYAWCSLDTLFLPMLIGETAAVESTCPVTGETIRLIVGPEGVRSYEPPTARASVVVPGETPSCDVDAKTGPASATCTQMQFFANPEAAAAWAEDHPGVAILTIEEAGHVAHALADNPCGDCC